MTNRLNDSTFNPTTLLGTAAAMVRNIYSLQQIWELNIPTTIKVYLNVNFPWSVGESYDFLENTEETAEEMMVEIEQQTEPQWDSHPIITEYMYFLEYDYHEIFKCQKYCPTCYEYMNRQFLLNNLNVVSKKVSYVDDILSANIVFNELCSPSNVCTLCKIERVFLTTKNSCSYYILD